MSIREYLFELATDKRKGFFDSAVKAFLSLFSRVYGAGVGLVSSFRLTRPSSLPCKVISVGNISLGGTGKTLLVEYVARSLRVAGRRPVILTRGYGRKAGEMGDEPAMLSRKLSLPVLVDPDRLRSGGRACVELKADAVVLDDGFQQWGIRKDLDIVCLDGISGFGNGRLLPRGTLREPLTALRRADIFVLVDPGPEWAALKNDCARFNPRAMVVEAYRALAGYHRMLEEPGQTLAVGNLGRVKACLVSGIGNPASFHRTAKEAGITVVRVFDFPDHHVYTDADIRMVAAACAANGVTTVVTTEKDEPRLLKYVSGKYQLDFLVLEVALRINSHEQEFTDRLLGVFSA